MSKIRIQINSDRFNGEVTLIPAFFHGKGTWQQSLNPKVTSTNDQYLKYSYTLSESKISLGEKWDNMAFEELMILSDFDFYEVGKNGTGFKRAHKYSSGQQLDADIPLTWKHLGFV